MLTITIIVTAISFLTAVSALVLSIKNRNDA
jgi:hypothetical protein